MSSSLRSSVCVGLEWGRQPPRSMQLYQSFLKWRADAGMNNRISDDLVDYFDEAGFIAIEALNSDETYEKGDDKQYPAHYC